MNKLSLLIALLCMSGLAWAQSPRGILVEKITSAGCPGCPNGSLVLEDLVQQYPEVIPVAIHLHDQWHADQMANADGDTILAHYWWAQPTAMIDRVRFADQSRMTLLSSTWNSKIAERQAAPLEVSLGATTTYDANSRSLSIDVQGMVLSPLSGEIRVNAYIVESPVVGQGLGYDQLNGYDNTTGHPLAGMGNPIIGYQHKWVLRDMLGGPWGMAGVIPNSPGANTSFSHNFSTTLSNDWDDSNTSIVVLVQHFDSDDEARSILNSISLGMNDNVILNTADAVEANSSFRIYPHPVQNQAVIGLPPGELDGLRLVDLQGRIIWERTVTLPVEEFSRGALPSGMYLLQGIQEGKVRLSEKMVLR